MATKDVHITNGKLTADPVLKTLEDGTTIWEFTMVENHADDASLWFNFNFYAEADHPILKKAKQGTSLQVFSKFGFKINKYTFSYNEEKKRGSVKYQAIQVDWGTFDSPKEKDGEKSKPKDKDTDFFTEDDGLVPTSPKSNKMKEIENEFLGEDE
jgi:Single-strand binding protein family.